MSTERETAAGASADNHAPAGAQERCTFRWHHTGPRNAGDGPVRETIQCYREADHPGRHIGPLGQRPPAALGVFGVPDSTAGLAAAREIRANSLVVQRPESHAGDDLDPFALHEAGLALMQMRGGPGAPRTAEARIVVATYLRAVAARAPQPRSTEGAEADAIAAIRDDVLHQRGPLAENGMTSEQINDVLAVIDSYTPAPPPVPQEREGLVERLRQFARQDEANAKTTAPLGVRFYEARAKALREAADVISTEVGAPRCKGCGMAVVITRTCGCVISAESTALASPTEASEPRCDCGDARARGCYDCTIAEYQAMHPDCPDCCVQPSSAKRAEPVDKAALREAYERGVRDGLSRSQSRPGFGDMGG